MKKKLLILSASIGLILACFPFTLCAEEDPESDLGVSPFTTYYALDDYFFTNYDQLPYIESDGSQYINTGVNPSSSLEFNITFGDLNLEGNGNPILFGSYASNNGYQCSVTRSDGEFHFNFGTISGGNHLDVSDSYSLYNIRFNDNKIYINNVLNYTFNSAVSLSNSNNIYIFNRNPLSNSQYASYKLYSFSLYDTSLNDGEGAYVRYYYPAKAKSGGTIGLYDAVSKTFITTSAGSPFEHPDGSEPIDFSVGVFINAGLDWIGDILNFAITEPLIICFMAIGLAGAMFRWGRRLVHF